MPPRQVDVAILGAGTAGLSARRAAKAAGASALMIDPGPFGTTCARVGCMPSKLVIAAAEAAHHARHAGRFGIRTEGVRIDGAAVMERVRSERDRFVGFVLDVIETARTEGELLEGRARVAAPGRLEIDDGTTVNYRSLVVAVGGRPFVPPPFREVADAFLTNEDIFELKALPESLLVVGLGVIGLELGQAFARLGVRTTLLGNGGAVGPLRDPEVLAEAQRVFARELDLHPSYTLKSIHPTSGGVEIHFVDAHGNERQEVFEKVLMAAGRRSLLDTLGLENLGVQADGRGRYEVDPDTLQLGDGPVFVAGDANNLHPILHEAADDGKIAGANAARFPDVVSPPRRAGLAVVFSDPQIGIIGEGYGALDNCAAVAGSVDFGDQGRARVQGINQGLVRVYAERGSGRLLGGELLGPKVEHLSHLLAWAVQSKLSVDEALNMPFYHPVVEEGLRTALRNLATNLGHDVPIKCDVTELTVGH